MVIDRPVHPAADLFPMLDEESLTALENNIKANGQHAPILLWNGVIVDGRNRYAACARARIKPKIKEASFADDAECVRYIISTNIHRRHLTESQRAAIAAELANLNPGNQSGKLAGLTQAEAAEQMQVSERSVRAAKAVQRDAPDLAAKVKAGEIKVSKAAAMARERTKPTDPDRADDRVVDAAAEAHAEGDTAKSRAVLAAVLRLGKAEYDFVISRIIAKKNP